MPLNTIDGYNPQFNQFVAFAEQQVDPAKSKAIARLDQPNAALAARTISAATDDKVYAIRRSEVSKGENRAVRDLFQKAVEDLFGGKDHVPDSVREAMEMKNFDNSGRPLTARRIMAVKAAIDREIGSQVNFEAPNARAGFIDSDEIVAANRAANFFMTVTGCTADEAIREIATPGTKGNRLMLYGGRFMTDVRMFNQGLKLMDTFSTWFTDVRNQVLDENNRFLKTRPRLTAAWTSPTAALIAKSHLALINEASDLRAFERIVFESLAVDAHADLSKPPEKLFGIEGNPGMRFFARSLADSQVPTIFQLPPAKRAVLYAAFDCFAPYTPGEKGVQYAMLMTNRILQNLDKVIALHDKGQLTPANLFGLCFPDVKPLPTTFNADTVKEIFENHFLARLTNEIPAGMGAIPLTMTTSGCTYDEAVQAYKEGRGVAQPQYAASYSTDVGNFDDTTRAGLKIMKLDLFRAESYSTQSGASMPNAHFSVTFPDAYRFDAVNTNDDNERTRLAQPLHDKIVALCGTVHPRQASAVMFGLTQGALSNLRFGFPNLGVGSTEHSAVDFTLSKNNDTGAINIRYASPPGCPITFSWTATVDIHGRITTTPMELRNEPTPAPNNER